MDFLEDDDLNADDKKAPTPALHEPTATKWYDVELPSKGKLGYPAVIQYRDILVRDEKIISTATTKDTMKVLNDVLKDIVRDSDSFFDQLTILDRDYLLMWIWANNYSMTKHLNITCQRCGTKEKQDVNLAEVDVEDLSDDYHHPFEYTLASGKPALLRLTAISDEKTCDAHMASNPKADRTMVMLALTTDLGTVMPLQQKLRYMEEEITGHDIGMIRAFHNHFKYGLDDEIPHECSVCQEVTPFGIPFSAEHFLPTLSNDFETLLRSSKKSGD